MTKQKKTMRRLIPLCLMAVVSLLLHAPNLATAADNPNPEAARFITLQQAEREAVLAQLQQSLQASFTTAKEQIEEQGELRPFAYVSDFQAQGRFLRLDPSQTITADTALVTLQQVIADSAVNGGIAASLLYVSASDAGALTQQLEALLAEHEDTRAVDPKDLRFLLVEMQHVAGLGLLQIVPYWPSTDGWTLGSPIQHTIQPQLHHLVRAHTQPG
ncbi:MAG: hypothetical protein LAT63_05985 [Marinobacter sp.]|nr:hypothetical protein [Marinobacter sp.]